MKQKLLIISRYQFGYHTDIYNWCYYLRDYYDIDIITLSSKKEKINLDNIKVHYVPTAGHRILNGILYVIVCIFNILKFDGKILVHHFRGCNIFKKIFRKRKMILDIRSLSVSNDSKSRNLFNNIIKKDTQIFDFITVVSEGVREQLCLPKEKSAVLPLGASSFTLENKTYDKLRLLYVGTLNNRRIDLTVEALSIFIEKHPKIDIEYDIIGEGKEKDIINNLIIRNKLEDIVNLHGFVHHSKLTPFFEKCNIGVSFIPITEYYEHQPPTKTFEYILSGLYTIATGTNANKEIINETNGYIITDSVESFVEGLEHILAIKENIKTEYIRKSLYEYSWRNIVENKMVPILNSIDK